MSAAKKLWTVADFATFMKVPHRQGLALLKKIDRELGGLLLRSNGGKKPEYTFFPALLAKWNPVALEGWENYGTRIASLEEEVFDLKGVVRRLALQTAANSRQIGAQRPRRNAA